MTIDLEKLPDSALRSIISHNIEIESRYHKIDELKAMINIADAMPVSLRLHIISIWCDSKASASYWIRTEKIPAKIAEAIVAQASLAFMRREGGFNYIGVGIEEYGGALLADAQCDWSGLGE